MRRFLKILCFVLSGALLALVALPWWLSPVLRGVAARYGVRFASYERVGYARFALRGVVVDLPSVNVTVERAEYATPALWLARRVSGKPTKLVATGWRVDVKPNSTTPPANTKPARPVGAMRLQEILAQVANGLDRWAPQIEIGAGGVTWPGGDVQLAAATWERRTLATRGVRFGGLTADVRAAFGADKAIDFAAKSETQAWSAALKNSGKQISGDVRWSDQLATITARLPDSGWMPAEAVVLAERWTVPAARLKLGQFYSAVRAAARIEWREGKFDLSADATGEAIPDRKAPPLVAKLRGRGDGESLTIESLAVDIPGVSAALSAPAVIKSKPTVM